MICFSGTAARLRRELKGVEEARSAVNVRNTALAGELFDALKATVVAEQQRDEARADLTRYQDVLRWLARNNAELTFWNTIRHVRKVRGQRVTCNGHEARFIPDEDPARVALELIETAREAKE